VTLDIIFQDEYLMVVNKPRGMVTHHGANISSGTLEDLLGEYLKTPVADATPPLQGEDAQRSCEARSLQKGEFSRSGIVHRLDKNTAGLLVVAKTAAVQEKLFEMMKNREIKRTYIGIVEGIIHSNGTINRNLIRSPRNRTKYITTMQGGREAVTHYEVVKQYKKHTLVWFRLETGRTHQIRVHSKSIGHPLVGDLEYNPKSSIKMPGQMLESILIAFVHPFTKKQIEVEIKPTQIFVDCLNKLG